jgi:purine-binding chemotaxis protein CheW
VEILSSAGSIPIGIIVDSVSEVLNISGEDIEPTPNLGSALNTDYILGLAKVKGRVKILLSIDRVLSADEESVFV